MKNTKINQTGISHLLIPLFIILAVAVAGTFVMVRSHAATPRCVGKVCKYTAKQKRQFASAAWKYWSDPERVKQGREARSSNIDDITSNGVTCKPSKVKIIYYSDLNDPAIARAAYHGAVKQSSGVNGYTKTSAKAFNKDDYCKIYFNFAYQSQITYPGYACAVFIHEYGHLLGRPHNNNPESPMYNGYAQGRDGSESFDQSISHTLDKSLCKEVASVDDPSIPNKP